MNDDTATLPKKRGRPPKAESDRKNTYLGFRVRDGMREKLEAAAEAGSRSPSEEIERRLIKSFEDEKRIAELERHIDVMKQTERLLWPDESARVIGQGFAMALAAARHASGQDWREDRSASLIVAGAVRRLMDRCSRGGASLMAELFDGARVAATADRIAETVGAYLDKAMPPLSESALDVAQWTGRSYLVTEFREAGTGRVLDTVTGHEFDATNPEGRPLRGDRYRSALACFAPIRAKVDAEDFEVFVMQDGTHQRVSLDLTPAGSGPQPQAKATPDGTRWATPDEIAGMKPARGELPESVDGRATFDDAVSGLPLVQAEKATAAKRREKAPLDVGSGSPEAPAPKRRGRAKAPA